MHSLPETLVTTYLEMTDYAMFRPAYVEDARAITILEMKRIDVAYYRFLYGEVGKAWRWRDRLLLSDEQLSAALQPPRISIYVLYVSGSPAGYVELDASDQSTEVAYFGLRQEYFGGGLGKHLLSYGVEKAWQQGTHRVWLHTCNLDGPHALANYRKRGFVIYDQHEEPMPQRYL